jgi:hypothetical protein
MNAVEIEEAISALAQKLLTPPSCVGSPACLSINSNQIIDSREGMLLESIIIDLGDGE